MGEIKKTGYEWSLEANHRILDLHTYGEDKYFTTPVFEFEYLELIKDVEVKENSTPRKTDNYLEWRMYGLVPYNISPIQSGIQYGHALQEYNNKIIGEMLSDEYIHHNIENPLITGFDKWRKEDKTFIVLNGGTTNENKDSKFYGTLQQHRDLLKENGLFFAEFKEPDLNDTLTAIVFLVDERVWNRKLYPDYINMPYPWNNKRGYKPTDKDMEKWEKDNARNREKWVEKIGGPLNDFLRTHLRTLKLA